eukprot:3300707-Amphidinium_carterae.1
MQVSLSSRLRFGVDEWSKLRSCDEVPVLVLELTYIPRTVQGSCVIVHRIHYAKSALKLVAEASLDAAKVTALPLLLSYQLRCYTGI